MSNPAEMPQGPQEQHHLDADAAKLEANNNLVQDVLHRNDPVEGKVLPLTANELNVAHNNSALFPKTPQDLHQLHTDPKRADQLNTNLFELNKRVIDSGDITLMKAHQAKLIEHMGLLSKHIQGSGERGALVNKVAEAEQAVEKGFQTPSA